MSESVMTRSRRKTTADYQAAAVELMEAMDRLDERMRQHQAESERLRAETQVIKARTEKTLFHLREQVERLSGAS